MFEYRCNLCGETRTAASQAEARVLRARHRDDFHGPDEIVEVGRTRFADLPREQQIATVVVAVVLLVAAWVRFG
ncbi:hypothetical protein H114_32559 [Streptomyces gancidicus BKS 13-15]|uniref:Uncharacterized protein n=1 Tax=Streptomyces gancidicus BKS 13-15 TaxID=1284664 RepID=M3C8H1_STREZ|nr:hypothetical protein [Streptomyces gancidicus]EMF20373.1 hypothetical protein H114_32559 [Streptomyces gancidicus BKS 13-15]